MTVIRVVGCREPWRGKHIAEQSCEYFKTPQGLPAIQIKWKGLLFSQAEGPFVFAHDASNVARVSDDKARFEAKASAFSGGGEVGTWAGAQSGMSAEGLGPTLGGRLGTLMPGAARRALFKPSEIKGFAVSFINEDGGRCYFMVVAAPEVVEEILASIPPEKMRCDGDPLL
jgi:hypothetical protein